MTHQSNHSDARPMARPPRRAAATLAVSLLVIGVAPTACDESQDTPASAAAAVVATHSIAIEGMHCESCVKAITAKVNKVDGVRSCTVDLASESATVDAVPQAMPEVREAIARLGFTVRDPDAPPPSSETVAPDAGSNPPPEAGPDDA